jgi:acyl dehydratase
MVASERAIRPAPAGSGVARGGLGREDVTRYGLALHRPGTSVPAGTTWIRSWAEGDRRQTVAESATSIEDVLKGIIGQPTGRAKVVVERAPVQHFADAVFSASPIYHSPEAAKQAGFSAIPAPPTFPFAMEFAGKFDEIQPSDAPVANPLGAAVGPLMAKGGLILHGEQEFLYHRPVQVGDVLVSEGKIVDAYQKESKGRTMTFIVQETNWSDEKTGEPVVTTRFNLIHRA